MASAAVKKEDSSPGKGDRPERSRKPSGKGGAAIVKEPTPTEKAQNWVDESRKYLKSVQAEAKRVAWPTQQQMKAFVAVVLATLIIVTGYLFLCDVFFTKLFAWIIKLLHGAPAGG